MAVDFTPDMKEYTGQGKFRYWVQMVLPTIYDDSLSYMELLNKVVYVVNLAIEDVGAVEENVAALLNAFNELQQFTNDYFDNLDIQEEINNKLDEMVEDGTFTTILQPLIENFQEQLNLLEARVDNLSQTITPGSTSGDAEIIDVRVAYNGVTYPTAGDSVRGQAKNLNTAIEYTGFHTEKTNVNDRWPRVLLPLENNNTYLFRLMDVDTDEAIDTVTITQGATTIAIGLENKNPAVFTPQGDGQIYLTVRYLSAPTNTPTISYYLTKITEGKNSVSAGMLSIDNNNKDYILNGNLNNAPINVIFGVNPNVNILNSPFTDYYTLTTYGKYPYMLTSGTYQVAVRANDSSTAIRIYNGVKWLSWNYIATNLLELADNVKGLYSKRTVSNSRWPRTQLSVENGKSYYIRVLDIISEDEYDVCLVSQGAINLVNNLLPNKTATFTPQGDDPVYLTVRYVSEPTTPPIVVYELIETTTNRTSISATGSLITNYNKEAICGGDFNNIPLNTIIAVGSEVELLNNPYPGKYVSITTIGKATEIRTTGDTQIALCIPDNVLAFRTYSSNVWGEWKYLNNTPVSRISGRKISIIGDSISTFNQIGYKVDGFRMAYPYLDVNYVDQTWWKRVLNASDSVIEVNASSSGSRVTNTVNLPDYPDFYSRCNMLGNPDTIFVALGTNDSLNNIPLGNYDYDIPIEELYDRSFRPAYIKGIRTLKANYPNAKIICLSLSMGFYYKEAIQTIAEHYDCEYIDVSDYTIGDDTAHPGMQGMRDISSLVLYPNN